MIAELAIEAIGAELLKAGEYFPKFRSPHEGLAIILEEFEELKKEVFEQHDARSITKMRHEAKQVAAMALRFMIDLT